MNDFVAALAMTLILAVGVALGRTSCLTRARVVARDVLSSIISRRSPVLNMAVIGFVSNVAPSTPKKTHG